MSKNLVTLLNESGKIQLTPAIINEKYIIRFCVNAKKASADDMLIAWNIIQQAVDLTVDEPLFSLERFSAEKLNNCLTNEKSQCNLTKLRRQQFTRMASDPNRILISIKTKHKFTRAQSFVVADIELIGETIL